MFSQKLAEGNSPVKFTLRNLRITLLMARNVLFGGTVGLATSQMPWSETLPKDLLGIILLQINCLSVLDLVPSTRFS